MTDAKAGRPRDPGVDAAISTAALKLMREHGFDAMSIEGVAAEAGVGKAAIYRRFADKADLVVSALESLGAEDRFTPTGDTRADLAQLPRHVRSAILAAGTTTVGAMIVAEHRAPELLESFRRRLVGPGRDYARGVLEAAAERGELREDADFEIAIDQLVGPFFARHMAGIDYPEGLEEQIAEAVWRSIARKP